MAMDLAKVKARLNEMNAKNTKSTKLWKPKPGENTVRIVPYQFDETLPFIELYFHYGINNKNYLSPSSFGKPDPIVEFSNKLKTAGDKESWKQGKSLEPKLRVYSAIIVRGEENEGVKLWGYGKQVYEQLLAIASAPDDYGDITDLKNGRDIKVTFTEGDGKLKFPETAILPKGKESPATDDKELLNKITKGQVDILTLFPEPTYAELEKALEVWIDPEKAVTPADPIDGTTATGTDATPEAEADKVEVKTTSSTEVEAEFDKLFAK